MKHIKEIEKELFNLLDIIRRDFGNRNFMAINYDVLFLVLIRIKSCQSEYTNEIWNRLINVNNNNNNEYIARNVESAIHTFIDYYELYNIKLGFRNDLNPMVLSEMIYYLDNIDFRDIKHEIELSTLFYNFFMKYVKMQFRGIEAGVITDDIVSNYISEIITFRNGDKVIDPFAGTGSLLFKVVNRHMSRHQLNVYFQEINQELYNLSEILMSILPQRIMGNECIDSINGKSRYQGEKFNYIISDIPFIKSNKLNKNKYDMILYDYNVSDIDSLLLMQVIDRLSHDGTAFLFVPDRILYKGKSARNMRVRLIEDNLIKCIIKFDARTFNPSGESLVVISKQKKQKKDGIQFINVDDKNFNEAVGWYKNRIENESSRIVSCDEISKRDYGLVFTYYDSIYTEVEAYIRDGLGYSLREVTELCKSTGTKKVSCDGPKFPCVKVSNLSFAIKEKYLRIDENIDFFVPMNTKNILSEDAVLISLVGNNLKPTIFSTKNSGLKSVYLANNCVALIPKSTEINVEYLYYQLYNPKIQKQIAGLKKGAKIPRLTYSDLLDVVILKPEFEKNLKLEEYRKESIDELEQYKSRYEKMESELDWKIVDAQNEIVSMLIHNVRKYFSQIGHGVKRIENFLDNNELLDMEIDPESAKKLNSDPLNILGYEHTVSSDTVREVIEAIDTQIGNISKTFVDTQKTVCLDLSKEDLVLCNLCEVLNEVVDSRKCKKTNNYEIIIECDNINMMLHKRSFTEFINNLIANAESHGFVRNREDYIVKFQVKELKSKIIIVYYNNGEKFDMTKEQYILSGRKGSNSNGSGQGGTYIYRTVRKHNGDFKIIETDEGAKFEFEFLKGDNYD